ncbi:class III lanthionine synthetase LanKC N-terminal domain-containing protein [Saccharothrix syringae]
MLRTHNSESRRRATALHPGRPDRPPGPHVLSDARWRDGPLRVGYGGSTRRHHRTFDGERVPAAAPVLPHKSGKPFR